MKQEIIQVIKNEVGNSQPLAFYLHIGTLLDDYAKSIKESAIKECVETQMQQSEGSEYIESEPTIKFFMDI